MVSCAHSPQTIRSPEGLPTSAYVRSLWAGPRHFGCCVGDNAESQLGRKTSKRTPSARNLLLPEIPCLLSMCFFSNEGVVSLSPLAMEGYEAALRSPIDPTSFVHDAPGAQGHMARDSPSAPSNAANGRRRRISSEIFISKGTLGFEVSPRPWRLSVYTFAAT